MGIDDVGAPVVLAHEFAHQIQAEYNLFDLRSLAQRRLAGLS